MGTERATKQVWVTPTAHRMLGQLALAYSRAWGRSVSMATAAEMAFANDLQEMTAETAGEGVAAGDCARAGPDVSAIATGRIREAKPAPNEAKRKLRKFMRYSPEPF